LDDEHAVLLAAQQAAARLGRYATVWQLAWSLDNFLQRRGHRRGRLDEYDTARTHCEAALIPASATPTPRRRSRDAEQPRLHRAPHRQAIGYYQRALTLRRTLGNRHQSAATLDQLGHPHVALGEDEQTRTVWHEALRLHADQGRDTDADRVRRQFNTLSGSEE
jgi:hypothetical protein